MSGIRTIDDIRLRCVIDEAGCWVWRHATTTANGRPAAYIPVSIHAHYRNSRRQAAVRPQEREAAENALGDFHERRCRMNARNTPASRSRRLAAMNTLPNPSGCLSVRHRIYRAPHLTLLQRLARLIAGGSAAMVEHLDTLRGQA